MIIMSGVQLLSEFFCPTFKGFDCHCVHPRSVVDVVVVVDGHVSDVDYTCPKVA